jgi:hypothetical protein
MDGVADGEEPLVSHLANGQRQLVRQARQIAAASAPSARSINRQYRRAENDVGGFGQALLAALRASGSQAADAYSGAVTQQQGVDAAAQDRLAGLGPGYAGAGVAVGAAGDSALSHLTALQSASGKYEAQLPAMGASRTALAQAGLANARKDALLQRSEDVRRQVPSILHQLAADAFNQNLALSQLGLSQARLNQSAAYENARLQQSAASQAQAQQHWRVDFIAKNHFDPMTGRPVRLPGGGTGAPVGFTPTQWRGALRDVAQVIAPKPLRVYDHVTGTYSTKPQKNFAQQGIPFQEAIQQLVTQQGFDPRAAEVAIVRLYRTYAGAPQDTPAFKAWASWYDWVTRGLHDPRRTGPH